MSFYAEQMDGTIQSKSYPALAECYSESEILPSTDIVPAASLLKKMLHAAAHAVFVVYSKLQAENFRNLIL